MQKQIGIPPNSNSFQFAPVSPLSKQLVTPVIGPNDAFSVFSCPRRCVCDHQGLFGPVPARDGFLQVISPGNSYSDNSPLSISSGRPCSTNHSSASASSRTLSNLD